MPEDIHIISKIKEINQKSFNRLFTVSCNFVFLASGQKENYKKGVQKTNEDNNET